MKYYVTSKISENIHETPEGYLVCVGVPIARTGEMVYGDGETPLETGEDGRILINREADEVFRPETIASFEGKAVTITHPTDFVSPDNWSRLAKGILQNVRRGDGENKDDLIADLLITDSVAINLVKSGLREVSCGYEAEYTQTGEGRGIQTNIIGNHLALVDEGRAGSAYAINDHKGKGDKKMSMKEKIKAVFAKAQDDAMKIADEEKPDFKKDDAKKDDAKDETAGAYDELKNMVKDLGEKIAAMSGAKDADKDADKDAPKKDDDKKDDAKDEEDPDAAASLEDRLKAVETAVAKLLEREANEDDVPVDGDEDEIDDDAEEIGDADESKDAPVVTKMTGDAISRMEILAPGLDAAHKHAKANAVKAFYATKDGKEIIHRLTGGKAPAYDNATQLDTLFIAGSELMKVKRSGDLASTKRVRDSGSSEATSVKTAEDVNAIMAKHYANK